MNFKELVYLAVERHASDVHLSSGNFPSYRVHGRMTPYDGTHILTEADVVSFIEEVLGHEDFLQFCNTGDVDAAYALEGCARFRVNAFKQRNGASLVMRIINANPPEMKMLNLPPAMDKILSLKEGLVLITGPTGSGKSTTLAALINEINKKQDLHIITIEDPVEYMHQPKRCVINQREVGEDSQTYSAALRSALREDPDVILMGEIRDLESMSIAMRAAETGHLVFSTLHTESAAKTIDRLIDMFPVERQRQALGQLSTTLKVVVSQRLLPRSDVKGRIGAFEILFVNAAIANLIRENKTPQIEQMISLNQGSGMITKQMSIEMLLSQGIISHETAKEYSYDVSENNIFNDQTANQETMLPSGMTGATAGNQQNLPASAYYNRR